MESVYAVVEEVYHIPRSLKLVLFHFIEDFLQYKVRSFFYIAYLCEVNAQSCLTQHKITSTQQTQ